MLHPKRMHLEYYIVYSCIHYNEHRATLYTAGKLTKQFRYTDMYLNIL